MTENHAQPLTGTEQRVALGPCPHRQREFVGSDHGTTFHRCLLCSSVLISQDGRLWVLPATPQGAAT